MHREVIVILAIQFVDGYNRLANIQNVEEYMNLCMDGMFQKKTPGPGQPYGQCAEWKDRNCCYENTTKSLQKQPAWQNFDLNHCHQRKNLSSMCRGHFIQNFCFYECSPNVGPWLVKVNGMDTRKERFYKVPLCKRECDLWWADCRDDYTCVKNWETDFQWDTGTNLCPTNSACQKFSDVYADATDFCESVFDQSYTVVNETGSCMVLTFHNTNPNVNVAKQHAQSFFTSQSDTLHFDVFLSMLFPLFFVCVVK